MAFEYVLTGTTRALWRMDSFGNAVVYDATNNNYDLRSNGSLIDYDNNGLFKSQVSVIPGVNTPWLSVEDETDNRVCVPLVGATTVSMWVQVISPIHYYIIKAGQGIELAPFERIEAYCLVYLETGLDNIHRLSIQMGVFNSTITEVYKGSFLYSYFNTQIYNNIIIVHSGAYNSAHIYLYINGELIATEYAVKQTPNSSISLSNEWYMPDLTHSGGGINLSECVVDGAAWSHDYCVAYGSQRSNDYNFTISPGI